MVRTISRLSFPPVLCLLLLGSSRIGAQSQEFAVQVAAVRTEAEAQNMISGLQASGLNAYQVKVSLPGKGIYYRVRFGRYRSRAEARQEAVTAQARKQISEFMVADYTAPTSPATDRHPNTPAILVAAPAADRASPEKKSAPLPSLLKARSFAVTLRQTPHLSEARNRDSVKSLPRLQTLRIPAPAVMPDGASIMSAGSVVEDVPPPPVAVVVKDALTYSLVSATVMTPRPEDKVTAVVHAAETPRDESGAHLPATSPKPSWVAMPPASLMSEVAVRDDSDPGNAATFTTIASGVSEIAISNSNWEVVRFSSLAEQHLRAVWFSDALNGWVAGDGGVLSQTTDGGRRWKQIASLAGVSIVHLYFADTRSGWMIGQVRTYRRDSLTEPAAARRAENEITQTVLFQTTDGGINWRSQVIPGITRLQFVNAKSGWAVGRNAALWRTTDGGVEWKRYDGLEQLFGAPVEGANYNFGFSDLHFTDAEHGWIIGNFYGRARTHIGGLFVTGDGGRTWQRVPLPIRLPKAAEPSGSSLFPHAMTVATNNGSRGNSVTTGRIMPGMLKAVRFTDANTGSVTGEMDDGETRSLFVLHTTDGGKTWEQFQTPGIASASPWFLSPVQGWAAAAPQAGAADSAMYDTALMHTEDGGVTWHRDLLLRGSRIRGIFFLSPTRGWAVGDRGMILRYEDHHR